MMKIGEKILDIRENIGLTQKEFAKYSGTSQSAIAFWENGKRNPGVIQLKKISKAFNIPIMELIECDFNMGD